MKLNIPPLSQRDPSLKGKMLNSSSVKTIWDWGCALDCVTMVCRYFGKDTDVARLNDDLVRKKGFYNNLLVWGAITDIYPDIKGDWDNGYIDCSTYPAPLEKIRQFLDEGYPVILKVDYSTKEGLQEHWVLAVGYNEASATKDLIINDPWDGTEQFFIGRIGDEAKLIYKIVVYKGEIKYEEKPEDTISDLEDKVKSLNEALATKSLEVNDLTKSLEEQERGNKDLVSQLLEARNQRDKAVGGQKLLEEEVKKLTQGITSRDETISGLRNDLVASQEGNLIQMGRWKTLSFALSYFFFGKGGGEK